MTQWKVLLLLYAAAGFSGTKAFHSARASVPRGAAQAERRAEEDRVPVPTLRRVHRDQAGKAQRAGQGHPEGARVPAHSPGGRSRRPLLSPAPTCSGPASPTAPAQRAWTGPFQYQEGIKTLLRKSSGMTLQEGITQSQVSLLLYFKQSFYKKYF